MAISSTRTRQRWVPLKAGFTLIEVLVVVAIIALLVSILIPSLKEARDQAKKSVCATNQHQIGLALVAYSMDHEDRLPYRGSFPYTVSEDMHDALGVGPRDEKVLTNLGLLHGGTRDGGRYRSWVGKEWDVLYCPGMYWIRDKPFDGGRGGGLETVFDGTVEITWGGYDYVDPLKRSGSIPKLGVKNVYPRDQISGHYWEYLQEVQGITDPNIPPRIPQGVQALVSDWNINSGSAKWSHGNGFNVLYSDSHVKFFQLVTLPEAGRAGRDETWYHFNVNP